jgi:hypothetical protein
MEAWRPDMAPSMRAFAGFVGVVQDRDIVLVPLGTLPAAGPHACMGDHLHACGLSSARTARSTATAALPSGLHLETLSVRLYTPSVICLVLRVVVVACS